jgi:Hint domain/Right handed beta helix region
VEEIMATLTVGLSAGFGYGTLAEAIAASQNGDVIQVQAGTYTNDFATITKSIVIEGVGGMVNLVATVPPTNLKGILTIGIPGATGPDVAINNVSFSGAAIPNAQGGNGAGIRYQSGNLVLNNTYFHDNQEGLLGNADPAGTITINNSKFLSNGNAHPPSSGIEHNLYVGAIQYLTIYNCYFSDPLVGHNIKSRALNTTIENSRIDNRNGNGSYEIDLPNGGNVLVRNTIIEKGANAGNGSFIAFGEEGGLHASSSLTVTGNTAINDYGAGARFVRNATALQVTVTDNTIYGLAAGQIVIGGPVSSPASNTLLPVSSAPAFDTSAPYLPVLPFTFACFAEGTLILTGSGQVPVEALRVGQQVFVVGCNARVQGDAPPAGTLQPIRWIGHRHIHLARHADRRLAQPVRIRAEAFAEGMPQRDLLVSPDHAVFADGMLIPARLLQNGATILRDDRLKAVRYFHVELDRHGILLAEGLPAESYLDTGNRGLFQNADVPLLLHPDLSTNTQQARRVTESCAPFAADAARVEPVWRRLAARALHLGYGPVEPATTTDPALRLRVDGSEQRPAAVTADRCIFTVPPNATTVRLVSRSAAPCDIRPWMEDRRQLGVAVERIVFTGPGSYAVIPADHPSLTDGWWAAERDKGKLWRWTKGDALLPLPPGITVVEVHLAGGNTYLRHGDCSGSVPGGLAGSAAGQVAPGDGLMLGAARGDASHYPEALVSSGLNLLVVGAAS